MRFSVVIPVYNVAPYLAACLDSVLRAGARHEVEIVCVDDGSTDGSGGLLDEYARTHANVRCLHRSNEGVSAARNAGLEVVSGDWILFVDADDVVRETWLDAVARTASEFPDADMISFGMTVFEDQPSWTSVRPSVSVIDMSSEIPDALAEKAFCTIAYRREIALSLRFRPFHFGEDLIYVCEAAARARTCVVIDEPEYAYRRRPGSAMQAEWTTERMIGAIVFCPVMFGALARSGKRIGDMFVKGRGDEWLFRIPLTLHRLRRLVDSRRAWEVWLESVKSVRDLPVMTRSHRLIAVLSAFRCRGLILLACRIALKARHWQRRRAFQSANAEIHPQSYTKSHVLV